MPHIFISYSRADVAFVRRLTASLQEAGSDVWIDVADIRSGEDWSDAIQQALDQCSVMVLVLSPESMDSVNVASEWKYYLDEGKIVIPVLLREARVNFRLRPLNYIDFLRQDYDMALAQLRAELERQGVTFAPPDADSVGAPMSDSEGGRAVQTLAIGVAIAVLALAAVILVASTLIDLNGDNGKKSGEPSAEVLAQTLVAQRDATQTAAALVLQAVNTPTADDLLQNPGFEAPFDTLSNDGKSLDLADGWLPWYVLEDGVYALPNYQSASAEWVRSGSAAQGFGGTAFSGGVYQRVRATPGTQYSFAVYANVDTPPDVSISVGVDPNGGTDATSEDIIWSSPETLSSSYERFSVLAIAQNAHITVFVRGNTAEGASPAAFVYVDDAALTVSSVP